MLDNGELEDVCGAGERSKHVRKAQITLHGYVLKKHKWMQPKGRGVAAY
jgi:hypothetical protein